MEVGLTSNIQISFTGTFFLISLLMNIQGVRGESVYDGVIIDTPGLYDAQPSHLFIEGVHHLFICGQNGPGDRILHSTNNTELVLATGWATPVATFGRSESPWAEHHVCDPSLLRGNFTYDSGDYEFALFYTADDNSQPVGVNGAIGIAFSNDLENWTGHDSRIILAADPNSGNYGAGEATVAWEPQSASFNLVYRDSTFSVPFWGSTLHVTSSDGINFSSPPNETEITTPALQTSGPGVAFSTFDNHWYAVSHTSPGGNPPPMALRLIRSADPHTLLSSWEFLEEFNMAFSGEVTNFHGDFARNQNGTLYVDENGWMYIFYTTGDWFPDFNTWKISQIRRRFLKVRAPIVEEGFSWVGPFRAPGKELNGSYSELGSIPWTASSLLVFNDGTITAGSNEVATVPIAPPGENGVSPLITVRSRLDVSGSSWGAVGFSTGHAGLFGGEIWIRLNDSAQTITISADGTTHSLLDSEPIPSTPHSFDDVVLAYDKSENTVSAWVNRRLVLDSFDLDDVDGGAGFTPDIQRAGVHLLSPSSGQTLVDHFAVNRFFIFIDGFESGDTSAWSDAATGF